MAKVRLKIRVSSKGQIVIPKEVREKYGFKKGSEVIITPLEKNKLLLERSPKLSELFGFLGKAEVSKLLLEEREQEASMEKERIEELGNRASQTIRP